MRFSILGVAAISILSSPRILIAQINLPGSQPTQGTLATTVTFTIPVNLTQLSADLEKVRAVCVIASEVLPPPTNANYDTMPRDELPVVGGQLISTLRVIYPIYAEMLLQNPTGKSAHYQCGLIGFSKSLQRWEAFTENSQNAAFILKPAPPLVQGTFTW